MSDAFQAFLQKREAEQKTSGGLQRLLIIAGVLAVIAVLAIIVLRGDPSTRPLNPNTATADELVTLPEVGPEMAKAIIAKRKEKPFAKPEDLLEVKGIGPKTLAKIKPGLKFE